MTSYPVPDEAIGDLLDQIAEQLGFPVPAHLRAARIIATCSVRVDVELHRDVLRDGQDGSGTRLQAAL